MRKPPGGSCTSTVLPGAGIALCSEAAEPRGPFAFGRVITENRGRVLPLARIAFWFAATPASYYAGAAACRSCHPSEFQAQSAIAYSRALAPAISRGEPPGSPGRRRFKPAGAGARDSDAQRTLEQSDRLRRVHDQRDRVQPRGNTSGPCAGMVGANARAAPKTIHAGRVNR